MIGLAGAIVKAFDMIIDFFKNKFKDDEKSSIDNNSVQQVKASVSVETSNTVENEFSNKEESFSGITLKLLRYYSNDDVTLGLLFINKNFFCYTIESSIYSKENKPLLSGIYKISFLQDNSTLTSKYKTKYPELFTRHINLKNSDDTDVGIIYDVEDHGDFNGFAVNGSLNIKHKRSFVAHSREAYRRLYLFLTGKLNSGIPVRIKIYDNIWIDNIK
jgi:hypothetical protein